jgi:hypothetical protein
MLEEKSSLKVTQAAEKAVKLVVSAVATLGIGAILAVALIMQKPSGTAYAETSAEDARPRTMMVMWETKTQLLATPEECERESVAYNNKKMTENSREFAYCVPPQ